MSYDDPKSLKKMTNEEFLSHCMNYSKYGALCQMVMMEVIERGVTDLLKDKEEHLAKAIEDEKNGRHGLVHIPSFIGAAEELHSRLRMKYYDDKPKKS